MIKRIAGFVLALCMMLLAAPFASAEEIVAEGQCGDHLTWTLTQEGILTISGTGDMWDYTAKNTLVDVPASVTEVVIETGVTGIGELAFFKCVNLRSVFLGPDVQIIRSNAFSGCSALTGMLFPKNVAYIGNTAFNSCTALETVEIRNGNITLGSRVFTNCSALTTVSIPAGKIVMEGQNPFQGTPFLKSSLDEQGFHILGEYLLHYGGTDPEPIIPASVRFISSDAFVNNATIRRITIPEGVEKIGDMAFSYCINLQEVVVADGVKYIGNMTFGQALALEKITFRGDFPEFHKNAFLSTVSVAYMPSGNKTWPGLLDCYGGDIQWVGYISTTGCGHKNRANQAGFDATCSEKGLTDQEICLDCGVVVQAGTVIPAGNHTWKEDHCIHCGATKPAGLMGDVDGNGKLTYNDALMILRYSIKLATLKNPELADMDGNGRVDYNDALKVLRVSIGLK